MTLCFVVGFEDWLGFSGRVSMTRELPRVRGRTSSSLSLERSREEEADETSVTSRERQ